MYNAIEEFFCILLVLPFLFFFLILNFSIALVDRRNSDLSATLQARTIRIAISHLLGEKREKNGQEEARHREEEETHEIFAAKQIRAGRGRLNLRLLLPPFFLLMHSLALEYLCMLRPNGEAHIIERDALHRAHLGGDDTYEKRRTGFVGVQRSV